MVYLHRQDRRLMLALLGPTDFTRRGTEFPGIILKGGILCYFWLDHVEVIAACFYLRRLGFKDGSVSCLKASVEIEGVCSYLSSNNEPSQFRGMN